MYLEFEPASCRKCFGRLNSLFPKGVDVVVLVVHMYYHTVVPNVENPPKNKFTQGDFTRFSMQVFTTSVSGCLLHIQNLSNRCRHKYDSSISRFFKNLIFGGLLQFGPTVYQCVGEAQPPPPYFLTIRPFSVALVLPPALPQPSPRRQRSFQFPPRNCSAECCWTFCHITSLSSETDRHSR